MNPDRNISPSTWMLINSSAIIIVLSCLYIVSALAMEENILWIPLLITDAGVFLLSYFIYRYILEKFIYDKIKLIYKSIHKLKSKKSFKEMELTLDKDIISKVNEEVSEWAQDRRQEIEELKKLEAYRREFLGNVSHELKTPLFNIQGYILTLLDGGLDDPTINKEYLQRSGKNIERMISIVEDLEVISRFETGELKLDILNFDIVALSNDVRELLEVKAKRKHIQLNISREFDKPLYVKADKERIRQVLINLLDNSIKYGRENGSTKVDFFDMDENLLIEVSDNGLGVDAKDIPRLFERFFRVDKSRSREQGGSGLGLSIVKHIIEAHQQTINVRSSIGVGTTFAFTLQKADSVH
ncbi:MAG: ATP-binding protein [Bacteroidetes bacterium]|nr:ATP-binding protein [Bacteroidota bacterium]